MILATSTWALGLVSLYILYLICLSAYRLFLSPLARFPGPKLAALTLWYEFYYDLICRGQYEFRIAKMHEKYGPIVRINPHELHINDPDFHDTLFPGNVKHVDKWHWQMKQFGNASSSFGTSDHGLHRLRRAAIAPLFSKHAVNTLQTFIQNYIDQLMQRLIDLKGSNTVVNMVDAFSAMTGDIVSDYAFGRPNGFLESSDFAPAWHQLIVDFAEMGHTCKHFGWYLPLFQSVPTRLAEAMSPPLLEMAKVVKLIRRQIGEVNSQRKAESSSSLDADGPSHRTVFHEVLESDDLPAAEKDVARLEQEGQVLLIAGTSTTADTLSMATFHLLNNPSMVQRMQEELVNAIGSLKEPRRLTLQELERLPYLTAIIKESLRLSYGVVQRTARIQPKSAVIFNEWTIPPGTPVSMSTWMTHDNPSIFPEPKKFRPERWLSKDTNVSSQRLEKYLLSFGKGTRQCLGLNLAYAELYLTLASLFSGPSISYLYSGTSIQLKLFETDESDILWTRDCFLPAVRVGSKGVRAVIE